MFFVTSIAANKSTYIQSVCFLQALSQELNSSAAGDNPGEVFPVKCDLSNEEDIKAMFAAVKERWGGVDALINNAGINLNVDVISGASDDMRHMWEVRRYTRHLAAKIAIIMHGAQ